MMFPAKPVKLPPNPAPVWAIGECPICQGYHTGPCPDGRIKSIEYHPDGRIKRVEYR